MQTQTVTRRPEPVDAQPLVCRSCANDKAVLLVEFQNVPCRCGLPPEGHPHVEPVCRPCRRMLVRARGRSWAWRNRN